MLRQRHSHCSSIVLFFSLIWDTLCSPFFWLHVLLLQMFIILDQLSLVHLNTSPQLPSIRSIYCLFNLKFSYLGLRRRQRPWRPQAQGRPQRHGREHVPVGHRLNGQTAGGERGTDNHWRGSGIYLLFFPFISQASISFFQSPNQSDRLSMASSSGVIVDHEDHYGSDDFSMRPRQRTNYWVRALISFDSFLHNKKNLSCG